MNGRASPTADIFNARNQLAEAFFRRVATYYARIFPSTARRVIEFGFLVQAFFVLCIFIYLHSMFVRSPITCLDKLRSQSLSKDTSDFNEKEQLHHNHYAPGDPRSSNEPWPRYGILRVEVIRKPDPNYSLEDSYAKEFLVPTLDHGDETAEILEADDFVLSDSPSTSASANPTVSSQPTSGARYKLLFHDPKHLWSAIRSLPVYICRYFHETAELLLNLFSVHSGSANSPTLSSEAATLLSRDNPWKYGLFFDCLSCVSAFVTGITSTFVQFCRDITSWVCNVHATAHEDNYIIEYALEYGFLRLSPAMRKRLNITVKLVVLDPDVDACFGGRLSRFLMDEFLGYDDLLLGSIKHLAVSESVKGHMANVVTGQHYRLVSAQMSRSSYLVATIVMLLFTFCVSTILRYSTHQLVLVIADILQLFETNVSIGIPATPFMTVILALVAIETIMSEFFGDSFTAFYVILIVSICDHYEAIFCQTEISKRYWPRFFYLYHFAFYAYHYRFNGQFSSMALWVSWLFTLHSMIYFFHHYELPNLLSDWELRDLITHVGSEDQFIGRFRIQMRRRRPWTGTLEVIREANQSLLPVSVGDSGSLEAESTASASDTEAQSSANPLLQSAQNSEHRASASGDDTLVSCRTSKLVMTEHQNCPTPETAPSDEQSHV